YLLICAGIGASIWSLHPLQVEAVAWVSALLHDQALFFLLLTLLFYLSVPREGVAMRQGRYWAALAAYAASLLSYPIALGLVVVLIIADVFVLRKFPAAKAQGSGE